MKVDGLLHAYTERLCFIGLVLFASSSLATDLMDVYRDALANDTTFKAAYSTYMANSEAIPQALSALLPQVTLNAQAGKAHDTVDAGIFKVDSTYAYKQWQMNATQAVFNYQAWKKCGPGQKCC